MNWLDKHQMKIFYFMLGFLVVFTVFIGFRVNVKASSNVVSVLPFNPNLSEYGLSETDLNIIQGTLDAYNYDYNVYDMPCIIFKNVEGTWFNYSTWGDVPSYSVYFVSTDSNDYVPCSWSTGSSFENFVLRDSNYYLDANLGAYASVASFVIRRQDISSINGWYCSMSGPNPGVTVRLFGSYNPVTVQCVNGESVTFVPYYPSYVSQPFYTSDSNYVTHSFLTNYAQPVAPNGETTEPDFDDSGHNITGHPNVKPNSPTITPRIPRPYNPPSIDLTNIESLLKSIFDLNQYNATYLHDELDSIFSWIVDFFSSESSYLADTILYSAQMIINNLQTGFTNLYQNFASLFEPLLNGISDNLFSIKESIDYIIEPIDSQEVQDSIEGTNFYGIYSDYKSFFTTFDSVITGTSEPNSLIIPIHLENISTLAQFGVTCQYLDLTQFAEIRSPLRAFCWVFCSFGAIMLVAHSLPDWLKGSSGGGSSSVSGKEG